MTSSLVTKNKIQMKNILKITCLVVLLLSLPVRMNACWWVNMFDWCGEPGDEFLITDDPASLSTLLSEYNPGNISQSQNYMTTTVPFQAVSDAEQLDDFNSNTTIQYFDGLGRLSQTVQKAGSPIGWNDLVAGVVYDDFGRKSGEWLPAVAPQGNGGAYIPQYQYLANMQTAYSEGNPFTMTKYEPSPLNRVMEQYGPGKDWQIHTKSQKTVYIANIPNSQYPTNYVKYFYVENDVLKCNGYYAQGTLYAVGSIDEDDKNVTEYTDKRGHKLLTRVSRENDTYYVYDDFDNLRYVLPPLAADALGGVSAGISEAKGSPVDLYGYVYKYDERKRNVVKKLPGCDSICMVYDNADRLIASQDGNQRAKNQWTVNKYDVFGRLLYSGIYTGNETRTQLAALYSNIIINETYTGTGDTGGYSCITLTPSTMLIVNYYDNYDFLDRAPCINFIRIVQLANVQKILKGTICPKNELTDVAMSGYTPVDKNHTKTLLTGTQVYHLNNSDYELTALYYDKYGNVVQTRSINHLDGVDAVYNEVDFLGKPLKTCKTHGINGTSGTITELYTYTYDKGQRLLTTKHTLNNGAEVTLSDNSYDELGRLKTKKIGNNVETVNYSYNIRNWLTGITSNRFIESLSYNIKPLTVFDSYYNGNITFMQWSIPSENMGYNRAYKFYYDPLNRLIIADYYKMSNGSLVSNVLSNYSEFMNYDKMGNISILGHRENGNYLNYLTLTYTGNHLKAINDAVNVTKPYGSEAFVDRAKLAVEYAYDANGNMIWDANSGISTIQYNLLNLPDTIEFSDGHKNYYIYDASGQKLSVTNNTSHNVINVPQGTISLLPNEAYGQELTVSDNASHNGILPDTIRLPNEAIENTETVTDYIGNMIYENGALKEILTSEGYWQNGVYYYDLKDHLGNNRVVIDGAGTIVEKSHYYPSGMRFQESTSNSAALPFRYGGKELEAVNGLNQYDFGARRRFASIPVTTTMDPLCEKYYPISPYAWCGNNPVNNVDLHGDSIWYTMGDNNVITMHMTGKVINNSGDNINMKRAANDIASGIDKSFSGKFKKDGVTYTLKTDIQLEAVTSMNDVAESDHLFVMEDGEGGAGSDRGVINENGGKVMTLYAGDYRNDNWFSNSFLPNDTRSAVHEFGHAAGLIHSNLSGNLMKQRSSGTNVTSEQREKMYDRRNTINRGPNSYFGLPYPYVYDPITNQTYTTHQLMNFNTLYGKHNDNDE